MGPIYPLTYPFNNSIIAGNIINSTNLTDNFLFYTNSQNFIDCAENFTINSNMSCNLIYKSNVSIGDIVTILLTIIGLVGGYIFFLSFIKRKANFFYGLDEDDNIGAKYYYTFFQIASLILISAFVILIVFWRLFLTNKIFELYTLILVLIICIAEMVTFVALKRNVSRNYNNLKDLVNLIKFDEDIKKIFKEINSIELWTFFISILTVFIFLTVQFTIVTILTIFIVILLNYIMWCQLLNLPRENYNVVLKDACSKTVFAGYIILETNGNELWILKENHQVIFVMKDSVSYITPQTENDLNEEWRRYDDLYHNEN